MAVTVGPGGVGKTSLRCALQDLPPATASTQGGNAQVLAVRRGQMLDLKEVDLSESRLVLAILQRLLGTSVDEGSATQAEVVISAAATAPRSRLAQPPTLLTAGVSATPVAAATSTSASAPRRLAADELHFTRHDDVVLTRLTGLQQKGVTEGVHLAYFDMGGQPEFAGLAAQFLRK